MIGRIVHKADFERALAAPSRIRSAHFALHHVAVGDPVPPQAPSQPDDEKLSTVRENNRVEPVDDFSGPRLFGSVIPKRHARRAVTRNLLRRQIRAAAERHAAALRPGLWVVRLRSPFARGEFPSAASDALRLAARDELEALFGRASRRA